MTFSLLITVGLIFFIFALIQRRLHGSMITPPLIFFLCGLGIYFSNAFHAELELEWLHLVVEVTLVLVLFADASRIDLRVLKDHHNLPLRMLLIGLPLVMIAGAVVAYWFFPMMGWLELALLAAILAPTDAALGQAVVQDPKVPVRIRQTLNIESGLNDGLALPAVLLFASLSSVSAAEEHNWVEFVGLQLILGPVIGALVGWVGAKVVSQAIDRGFMSGAGEGLAVLALALLAFVGAEAIGGNGFISAFVAGGVFGTTLKQECEFLYRFMEAEGEMLMLVTFLAVGMLLLPEYLMHINFTVVIYAFISLTVVRMVPISLSLLGTGLRAPTHMFLGWFGPRGLASILFALLVVEEFNVPSVNLIVTVVITTVAMSIVMHGITAAPLARIYGQMVSSIPECEEKNEVQPLPLRSGPSPD